MAQSVVINGVTYSNVPEVDIPLSGGGTAKFYDPSDGTATADNILSGKTAYIGGGKVTGQMDNNGTLNASISTRDSSVEIPVGYLDGGSVGISSTEKAKIISGNIRSGVTILGISGSSTVVDTSIASGGAATGQILSGYSAYVNGSLVSGSAVMPTISQDSTTKVLSIS